MTLAAAVTRRPALHLHREFNPQHHTEIIHLCGEVVGFVSAVLFLYIFTSVSQNSAQAPYKHSKSKKIQAPKCTSVGRKRQESCQINKHSAGTSTVTKCPYVPWRHFLSACPTPRSCLCPACRAGWPWGRPAPHTSSSSGSLTEHTHTHTHTHRHVVMNELPSCCEFSLVCVFPVIKRRDVTFINVNEMERFISVLSAAPRRSASTWL